MKVPVWLQSSEAPERAGLRAAGPPKERFAIKSLAHAVGFARDAVFSAEYSARGGGGAGGAGGGFLARVGPGFKIAGVLFLIILVSLQITPRGISAFTALSALLAMLSRIPPARLIKRLLPVALFTAAIAAPSALNLVVDGETLVTLISFGSPISLGPLTVPAELTLTREGALVALRLLLRVVTSVSFVFLLTMTTAPRELIRSVSSLLPGTMGMVFSISYRYIYFLLRKFTEFITAYRARNAGGASREGARWAAASTSSLFSISLKMSRSLEKAMEARGCRFGSPGAAGAAAPRRHKMGLYDALWAALLAMALIWSATQ